MVVDTMPELLAHHYGSAALTERALPYWLKAGQRAARRSANREVIGHLTKGLEQLSLLPDDVERARQELAFRTALGPALLATSGWGAPEAMETYLRARALCERIGSPAQLFPILWGTWMSGGRAGRSPRHEGWCTSCSRWRGEKGSRISGCRPITPDGLPSPSSETSRPPFVTPTRGWRSIARRSTGPSRRITAGTIPAFAPWLTPPHSRCGWPATRSRRCGRASSRWLWRASCRTAPAWRTRCSTRFGWTSGAVTTARLGTGPQRWSAGPPTRGRCCTSPSGRSSRVGRLPPVGRRTKGIGQLRRGLDLFQATGAKNWAPYYGALLAERLGKAGRADQAGGCASGGAARGEARGGLLLLGSGRWTCLEGELRSSSSSGGAELYFRRAIA